MRDVAYDNPKGNFQVRFGFTGTQKGMTLIQTKYFRREFLRQRENLQWKQPEFEFHHGDCIGADEQAHNLLLDYLGVAQDQIWIHPCTITNKRAYCKSKHILDPKPPLERNDDIVHVSEVIFAAPFEREEQQRSGTWYTIRRVRKYLYGFHQKKLIIIYPNGEIDVSGK